MPEQETMKRAAEDKRQGKSASTQAGEFIREEVRHIRKGKHGARSSKQAIAIGLSKARRAGVDLKPPAKGKTSEKTRKNAERAYARGHGGEPRSAPSPRRSHATENALKREPNAAVSHRALSRQAHKAAEARTAGERSASARKAARTRAREN
jgi:hypothetical protein